jgi:LCP family protein required for cell wall assembly
VDGRESHVPSPDRRGRVRRAAGTTATHPGPPAAGRLGQRSSSSTASTPDRRRGGVPPAHVDPDGHRSDGHHPGGQHPGSLRVRRQRIESRQIERQPAGSRYSARTRSVAPRPGMRLARRLRMITVLSSALVLGLTGVAWSLYRDVTAGIATTGIIAGGWNGGAQNVLLVGVDSRTDAQGKALPPAVLAQLHSGPDTGAINSDTIMLLHVPADGRAAVAFSIPRDSYVDIPGYRRDKINTAYPAKKAETAEQLIGGGEHNLARVETESAEAGRRALVGAVEDLTGLTVDHYAEINLAGFHDLTTTLGGVDVCLKAAVNDPLSGARFPAGPQTIFGANALAFVRQRHGLPDGDLSRIRRQQVFMAAAADKILSARTLTDPAKLEGLVQAVQSALVIDAGWDLLAFAQQASDIAAGNLRFLTIPTRGPETNDRGDVVLVDRDEVRDFVERSAAEQEAAGQAAADAPGPVPPLTGVIAERYVVDVRNASETVGLASAVALHVRDLGFIRGTVDNSAPVAESVVRYTGSDGDAAEALGVQLGGIAVEQSDEITPGHLMVVLGSGFDPGPVPGLAVEDVAPTPADPTNITAAGVPCID